MKRKYHLISTVLLTAFILQGCGSSHTPMAQNQIYMDNEAQNALHELREFALSKDTKLKSLVDGFVTGDQVRESFQSEPGPMGLIYGEESRRVLDVNDEKVTFEVRKQVRSDVDAENTQKLAPENHTFTQEEFKASILRW